MLIKFVKWFYKDDEFENLDYEKMLAVVPLASAMGYIILNFLSFFITSLIFSYYGIGMGCWSFNQSMIYSILLFVILVFGIIFFIGKYFEKNKGNGKIINSIIKFLFISTIFDILLKVLSAANIIVGIIWQCAIMFLILLISILFVQYAPRILKSVRRIMNATAVFITLICIFIVMFNTCWKKTYDTVSYDSNMYIVGVITGDQFYLIEYNDKEEIITDHYRFVDKTDVTITKKKLTLHPVRGKF